MGKGALVFKGDAKPTKKKKKAKHTTSSSTTSGSEIPSSETAAYAKQQPPQKASSAAAPADAAAPKIQTGAGLITTSGTVVTGHNGTQFLRQLRVGDALMVGNEMRVVTMCLSNASVNLSSALGNNLTAPTPFSYITKPRSTKALPKNDDHETGATASGTYASNQELVYREKTQNGSYRIVKKQLDQQDVTRGDLLEMRAKKKSDKYC
jgi:hypothetical protein